MVTVDGSSGAVYDGVVEIAEGAERLPGRVGRRLVAVPERTDRASPSSPGSPPSRRRRPARRQRCWSPTSTCAARPEGLWNDLEHLPEAGRTAVATAYLDRVRRALDTNGMPRVGLLGEDLPPGFFDAAVAATGDRRISMVEDSGDAVAIAEALTVAAGDRRRSAPRRRPGGGGGHRYRQVLRAHPGGAPGGDARPRLAGTLVDPAPGVRDGSTRSSPPPSRPVGTSGSRSDPSSSSRRCSSRWSSPGSRWSRGRWGSPTCRRYVREVDPLPLPLPRRCLRRGVGGDRAGHLGPGVHGRPQPPGATLLRPARRGAGALPDRRRRIAQPDRGADGGVDHVVVASVGRVLRPLLVHPGAGRRHPLPVHRGDGGGEPRRHRRRAEALSGRLQPTSCCPRPRC